MSASDRADALSQLVGLVSEYGSLPRAVFALVSLYLLNGIFGILGVIVGSVLFVFDLLVASLETVRTLLVSVFGAAGLELLGALLSLERAIAGVVETAGPVGPPIAVGVTAVLLYVLYRVAVALIGEIPGGSTIVDLLRLR